MTTSIIWFRRDLRLADNPALLAALDAGDDVLPVFVSDKNLAGPSGAPRLAFLYSNLHELNDSMDGHLVVRSGDPATEIAKLAHEVEATQVFCAEDFGPYGRRRDSEVETVLAKHDITLERVDSNYAVAPGEIRKADDTPYQVFTPFSKVWAQHGWGEPRRAPRSPSWAQAKSDGIPKSPRVDADLPAAGESAAHKRLKKFMEESVNGYKANRDNPGIAGTSRMSPYLKYGIVHPRQLLTELGAGIGPATF